MDKPIPSERRSIEAQYVDKLMADLPDREEWTLKQSFLNLFRLATLDELTGVFNRNGLKEGMKLIKQGLKSGEIKNVGAIYLDIDDFKTNQDTRGFGHDWGDEALRHFAFSLEASVRDSDLVVRIGGDEFCLILPQTDNEKLGLIVNRVFENLTQNPVPWNETETILHTTWGKSVAKNEKELNSLVSKASGDMEKEKRARKRGR